ncbi:MAG: hypothetical protein ACI9QL_003533 [Candidatus Omnitrophota bacterium]|jgi:hypothetical protein
MRIVSYLAVFFASCVFADSDNMLLNGDFKAGMNNWEWIRAAEYVGKATEPVIVPAKGPKDLPSCVQKVPHRSAWHYLRIQQPVVLQNGEAYKVTLDVKSLTKEGVVRIATWNHTAKKNNGLSMPLDVVPTWKRFEVRFRAREVEDDSEISFIIGFGDLVDTISVRNVSFVQISDTALKAQAKNEIALEKPSSRPAIQTVDIKVDEMIEAFATDLNAAKREYVGKNLSLNARVTKVEKGPRPGSYKLLLEGGKISVLTGGSDFTAEQFEQLEGKLKSVRREIKDDEDKNEAVWGRLDREGKAAKELTFYPLLSCIARISNYRDKVIEIERTMGLTVGF